MSIKHNFLPVTNINGKGEEHVTSGPWVLEDFDNVNKIMEKITRISLSVGSKESPGSVACEPRCVQILSYLRYFSRDSKTSIMDELWK